MSNWGQGPGGYQYPLQTGFPQQNQPQQQQFGQPGPGLAPQPTGFPGQRPPFQQPQQTGFPGGPLLSQPTGFAGAGGFAQRPPPPPVPPVPSQFSQFNQQQPRLAPQPTGFPGPGGLQPQPTGFPGAGGLVPQVTGFVDPRLQMMSATFLPANQSTPYTPQGAPQLLQPQQQLGGLSLQQSFQQHNQEIKGTAAPRVPWALSKGEKKSYDQIFRAWDTSGTGFIDGQTAIQVFGQSGLDKDSLAKIWALADADNRGKLNIAEFHVAMGLIYRKLNGNEIPDKLPAELIPPSHRDLDEAVNFVKTLTKNDPVRSSSPSQSNSYLKVRSFGDREAPGAGGRQDATVYKHTDAQPSGGFYTPRSRHIDRNDVRGNNDRGGSSDISDLKRQLEKSASRLDAAAEESSLRTREDEELDREMDDLRYRAKRIRDDLEYLERAPRTPDNDDERRRLERSLLTLLHERIPDVERRVKDREARKEREKRERDRARDDRNQSFGRYNDRDRDDYRSYSRNEDRDRYGGGYDRDRDRDRDGGYRSYSRNEDRDRYDDRNRDRDRYDDRDRDRDRLDDRGYDRPPARTPPPAPPAAPPASGISKAPPPPPAPTASPAPNLKNMTPAEKQAYIKEQAAKRLAERMAALGVSPSPSSAAKVDTSVEDRLARERQEAEEKAKEAEKAAEERERARAQRLNSERGITESPTTPTPSAPAPAPPAPPAPSAGVRKAPPPAPAGKKAPAPPPPRGVLKNAPRPPAAAPSPPVARAPAAPPAPLAPAVDPEEERLKQKEAELKAQREARLARLRQLEAEEEEERKREEAELEARAKARREAAERRRREEEEAEQANARAQAASAPPAPAPPPPPAPPAPPAPGVTSPGKTNPFSKMMAGGGSTPAVSSPPAANGGTNPFFKPQQAGAAPTPPPAPPAPPVAVPPPRAPSAPAGSYNVASKDDSEDDWGVEKDDDDDSSDDEISANRDTRAKIAQQLFGSILPSASPAPGPRPTSAAGVSSPATPTPASFAPPPPAPPAPPAAPPAPPAPGAPPAPPPPAAAPAAAPGDRGALLSAIQGGARLRKAVTNDRSAAPVGGRVIGDTAPPAHINTAPVEPPREPSPPPPPPAPAAPGYDANQAGNRQSVDWYAGLAADQGAVSREPSGLNAPREEDEDEAAANGGVPEIEVHESEPVLGAADPLEDVDKSKTMRVRTLYPYEGQRAEDISFGENVVLTANPSKSGGEWWYGTSVRDGKAGFFPKAYVQEFEPVKAKALYSYEGTSPDELPFVEGDEVSVVDRSEPDWWKAEQGGVVFIVPAAYLEVASG